MLQTITQNQNFSIFFYIFMGDSGDIRLYALDKLNVMLNLGKAEKKIYNQF